MNYDILLDIATDVGYKLAICGAETYRVEESVNRILAAYGVESEVFSIPNSLIVGIKTDEGKPITRIRRIAFHGNDLDGVERYNSLSRRICAETPDLDTLNTWLKEAECCVNTYPFPLYLIGHFLVGFGFSILFGGTITDSMCSGVCAILVGLASYLMDKVKITPFFGTLVSAFLMTVAAHTFRAVGIASNIDTVVIGALMVLVPGLLITNAMRDVIFGDTNSGMNRIMQVLLIAMAIALGTASAWNISVSLWGTPITVPTVSHAYYIQILACLIGCLGFSFIFNIHGSGFFLCVLGGGISWAVYCTAFHFSGNDLLSYFFASVASAVYAEVMARIRKYPAISYLVISILPMIPGAGVYYTTNYLIKGDMINFAAMGIHTISIASMIAVGILLVSTLVRLLWLWKARKNSKKLRL